VLTVSELTLGAAAKAARSSLSGVRDQLVAWWCKPSIDFSVTSAPAPFGREWPDGSGLRIDEAVFCTEHASWRVAGTANGMRWVYIAERESGSDGVEQLQVVNIPVRLHSDTTRFSEAELSAQGRLIGREWRAGDSSIGFTLAKEQV
jgi:hypothetical protein